MILVNVFHRIARFLACNYVKGEGCRFWLVIFHYFSLYRLKLMSINKYHFWLLLYTSFIKAEFLAFKKFHLSCLLYNIFGCVTGWLRVVVYKWTSSSADSATLAATNQWFTPYRIWKYSILFRKLSANSSFCIFKTRGIWKLLMKIM